jgi:hypothetical protein
MFLVNSRKHVFIARSAGQERDSCFRDKVTVIV